MTYFASLQPLPAAGVSALGEGPVWEDRSQTFFWVDIEAGSLQALDPATGSIRRWPLGGPCGFAVPTTTPDVWIAARGAHLVQLSLDSGAVQTLHALDEEPTFRCNDAKCDPSGRLWVGTMPASGDAFTGTLYTYTDGQPPRPRRREVACSNGLACSPDGTFLYFIDSGRRRIDRYRTAAIGPGELSPPEILISFDEAQGIPDGMTIDRDGHLWVAFWGGSCIRQIDGRDGTVLRQIDLPASQITSCAFGGPELDTLYITSARTGLDAPALQTEPLAGSVFTCRPGSQGLPVDRFALA